MGWEEDSSTPIDEPTQESKVFSTEFCFATASWHSREAIFAYSEVKGGKRSQFSKLLRLDELAWTDFLSGARRRRLSSSCVVVVGPSCLPGRLAGASHTCHTHHNRRQTQHIGPASV